MSNKILIFGATGAVGSSLSKLLKESSSDCHLIGKNEEEVSNLANETGHSFTITDVLEDNFIDYGVYYPYGLHQFPISQYDGDKIENVEWATKNVITLPNHPNLDLEDVDFICDLINNKKWKNERKSFSYY